MPRFIDLTGKKFGRLVVLRYIDRNKWGDARWLCLCDCGEEKIVQSGNLKNGHTRSCGCLRVETTTKRLTKHGHNRRNKPTRTYRIWYSIIQRCINPNHKCYKNYGGRGITVYKRWMKFENFLEDMGEMPEGHQIDRINNNGNYCKSNCHWVTPKTNSRNKRNNHLETYMGKTQCLIEWAEEYNINYKTLYSRICILGWTMEKALTTPVKKFNKNKGGGG